MSKTKLTFTMQWLGGCLVSVFKQQFLVFKQHFTYFHTFFQPHVFLQKFLNNNFQFLNTYTKRAVSVTSICKTTGLYNSFSFLFLVVHKIALLLSFSFWEIATNSLTTHLCYDHFKLWVIWTYFLIYIKKFKGPFGTCV